MSKLAYALAGLAVTESAGATNLTPIGPSDGENGDAPGSRPGMPSINFPEMEMPELPDLDLDLPEQGAEIDFSGLGEALGKAAEAQEPEWLDEYRQVKEWSEDPVGTAGDRARDLTDVDGDSNQSTSEALGERGGRGIMNFFGGVSEGIVDEGFNELGEAWQRGQERGDAIGASINERIWGQPGDPYLDGLEEGSRADRLSDALSLDSSAGSSSTIDKVRDKVESSSTGSSSSSSTSDSSSSSTGSSSSSSTSKIPKDISTRMARSARSRSSDSSSSSTSSVPSAISSTSRSSSTSPASRSSSTSRSSKPGVSPVDGIRTVGEKIGNSLGGLL